MEEKKMPPDKKLVIDSNKHFYKIGADGKNQKASYIASLDTFDGEDEILVCSFGIVDSPDQHMFSSKDKDWIVNIRTI